MYEPQHVGEIELLFLCLISCRCVAWSLQGAESHLDIELDKLQQLGAIDGEGRVVYLFVKLL